MPCNHICAPHNHKLHRLHASCFSCSTRKSLKNPKYAYDAEFQAWLPPHFDAKTAILNDGTGYIIYTDDDRFARLPKSILLDALFDIAERSRYTKIAKRLYTVCEFLAT